MTTEHLIAFKEFLRRYVIESQPLSESDYMSMYDLAFQIAVAGREYDFIRSILESFAKLKQRVDQLVDIDEGKYRYIVNHPIIGNKDVNERIARMAFGYTEEREYISFRVKATFVNLIAKYIHRFYIPNKQNAGAKLVFEGRDLPYNLIVDMVMQDIWGHPPSGIE
jgi:effector-binding domain-containing protein